ncbi:FAD:protein FMN transferase [uncultured Prevotella sp.]|uniref:FAD:protein FMN transferase n=1 Tax=uncultured Prevotella sp. TaxID=159272 RepID=UPI002627FC88|nr:FAD:protein FMN transferase [uncultured Prevotella sp.]
MNNERNKKKLTLQLSFLIFLIVGTIIIVRQQRTMPYQHNTGFIFGTVYNVTYQSDKDLQKEIEAELKKVDESLSPFNKNSIISKINRNENVEVNEMFADVFNLSQKISEETDGAFDITVAPLVNAWGFGFKNDTKPTAASIDSLKQIIGYKKVRLKDKHVVKEDKRIMLDCSAIAKGYGSDAVARLLRSKGIDNFMVEIGGEIVTKGINEKRLPWKIGVIKPVDDSLNTNQEIQTILNVTNKAMATSGNYRNFYYKNGKKYAHTIDPKTGYPVQHSILSATVLAADCATADAYATSFMVMGMEKAKEILNKHPELMAYFIYSDKNGNNAVWYSPSLKDKIAE